MKKKEKIILIGAGGHAVSCIDVIESTKKYEIYGLIDNFRKNFIKVGKKRYKIFNEKLISRKLNNKTKNVLICLGFNLEKRQKLFFKYKKMGFKFPVIQSSKSYVSQFSRVGEGTIIMHGAIINANATIGANCIINSKSLVEHDVKIGDSSHISTASVVNGHSVVGKNCFLGSNSTVIQSIKIKNNSFVKAGSLVKKDV